MNLGARDREVLRPEAGATAQRERPWAVMMHRSSSPQASSRFVLASEEVCRRNHVE